MLFQVTQIYIIYILYIHDKFVIKKWVNRRHFFIDEKNLQKFHLTAELKSV